MSYFDYHCPNCQHKYLTTVGVSECPKCGQENTGQELGSETPEYHDSVKTSGFMEHSGKLYKKVGGDRSYWTLKSIARGHRIYGLLCLLASIGCVVLGVYFLVAQERFEENLYEKYRSYALFTVAFPLFSFGIFMLLIKEIIMLVVNVAEDFSVIAKEASEIRKAIVDKND